MRLRHGLAVVLVSLLDGLLLHMILNVGVEVDGAFMPALKRSVLAALGGEAAGEAAGE